MTQEQRRIWLIEQLLAERNEPSDPSVPDTEREQRMLLRALFNVRPPEPVSDEFLAVQDAYLQQLNADRGSIDPWDEPCATSNDPRLQPGQLIAWQGDITCLSVDAIVNAANDQMLGCFVPGHSCIDNAIHTFAGIQLRLACAGIMAKRGRPEPTATATVTPAFNLPAKQVIHTVGPIVQGGVPSPRSELLLKRCYTSCLEAAEQAGCSSIAFCCISTGVFGYPQDEAAKLAVATVADWLVQSGSRLRVCFDVFGDRDRALYEGLLNENGAAPSKR